MMAITVKLSSIHYAEKKYVLDVIFEEFLGLSYSTMEDNSGDYSNIYEITPGNGNKIVIADDFFCKLLHDNYVHGVVPSKVNLHYNHVLQKITIPVIYGTPQIHEENINGKKIIYCKIDLFASIFFMLSRWEEVANTTRDQHDRFPAYASLAYKNGFLERPIVNEYIELLWDMLVSIGFDGARKNRNFALILTHDVDTPFLYANRGAFKHLVRIMASKAIKGKMINALKQPLFFLQGFTGNYTKDPFYTFPYILNLSEKYDCKSTFYFLAGGSTPADGKFYLNNPATKKLMQLINDRGHYIGLHGSYNSYNDMTCFLQEMQALFAVTQKNAAVQNKIISRQHYLRWDAAITPSILNMAGIEDDSTLSYADHIGFRCGTCYEFSMFDLKSRKKLRLKEKPLIVMEGTVLGKQYMGLDHDMAFSRVCAVINQCKKFNGNFVLLWHNSSLVDKKDRRLYENILEHANV